MPTKLHWIAAPWLGRLAIMPRPRGGDWLEDELQSWRQAGVDVVVSLLTREEQTELSLAEEQAWCDVNGLRFVWFPIADRSIPLSHETFLSLLTGLASEIMNGKNVAVHCRQGIGRAALVAICLLILSGDEPTLAIQRVASSRGCSVPETPEQRRWIDEFAPAIATSLPPGQNPFHP